MSITLDSTLAEVVTERPGAARTLESFGLDYCCGGQRSIENACVAAGVDPDVVLGELDAVEAAAAGPGDDWPSLDPGALARHVVATHHAYLHAELPRLGALVEKVVSVHGDRHPELHGVRTTFQHLRSGLEPHLAKEELILFPMIEELATGRSSTAAAHCGTVANPIAVMTAEHDRDGELLAELRRITDGYTPPADGCASYRALYEGLAALEADTHLHIHKENNVLFPAAIALA